jgi:hypothetical protein
VSGCVYELAHYTRSLRLFRGAPFKVVEFRHRLCISLYQNMWLWTADHDLDQGPQVDIYAGRGILDESTNGPVWLIGTGKAVVMWKHLRLTESV